MPVIRVIIPTFNRAALLHNALVSVLAQEYRDLEVIVADDGSTDETETLCRRLALEDGRLRYLKLAHEGVSVARNKAIELPGDFEMLAFLDSDDSWHSHHLARIMEAFARFPDAALAFARAETFDMLGQWNAERMASRERSMRRPLDFSAESLGRVHLLRRSVVRGALLRGDFNPHPSTVVVRASAMTPPWFNPALSLCEDCELFVRLAARTDFLFVDDVHARVNYHGDNLTGAFEFASDRSLSVFERHALYADWKLAQCTSAGDRTIVARELAGAFYRVGQCWAERRSLAHARRAYLRSWAAHPSYLAAKGIALSCLPSRVYKALRGLKDVMTTTGGAAPAAR